MNPKVQFRFTPSPVQAMIKQATSDLNSGQYNPPRDAQGRIIIESSKSPFADIQKYDTDTGAE